MYNKNNLFYVYKEAVGIIRYTNWQNLHGRVNVKKHETKGRQSEFGSFKTEINLHGVVQLEAAAFICCAGNVAIFMQTTAWSEKYVNFEKSRERPLFT